jgi:hypothetical protein
MAVRHAVARLRALRKGRGVFLHHEHPRRRTGVRRRRATAPEISEDGRQREGRVAGDRDCRQFPQEVGQGREGRRDRACVVSIRAREYLNVFPMESPGPTRGYLLSKLNLLPIFSARRAKPAPRNPIVDGSGTLALATASALPKTSVSNV